MRREFTLVSFVLLFAALCVPIPALLQVENSRQVVPGPGADTLDCASFLPYATDPDHLDPNHLWNRVHRQLIARRDARGKAWGCDEVDPLLWQQSQHILASPRYVETLNLLDEFRNKHAEQLVHDPLQRAIFQHDLWAVFDWLAQSDGDHYEERAELEWRLAAIMKAVALTPTEIQNLPDNYASLQGSITGDGLALPGPGSGWLRIGREDWTPAAPAHFAAFPRSLFLVYLKLPPGGLETTQYLESLRTYSRQRRREEDCDLYHCDPPQFPVGTELALVRRTLLIDTTGRPTVSPITESVQLRRYVKIPAGTRFDFDGSTQQTAEFVLTRRALQQGAISLRRVGADETDFPVFNTHGIEDLEDGSLGSGKGAVTLRTCHSCHQGVGVYSFTTYSRAQFEREPLFVLLQATTEVQEAKATIRELQSREEWELLRAIFAGKQ
jgi:hypothetical protein